MEAGPSTAEWIKNMLFALTWVDLKDITLGKISQTEKDKYRMSSLTHGIKKKKPKPSS